MEIHNICFWIITKFGNAVDNYVYELISFQFPHRFTYGTSNVYWVSPKCRTADFQYFASQNSNVLTLPDKAIFEKNDPNIIEFVWVVLFLWLFLETGSLIFQCLHILCEIMVGKLLRLVIHTLCLWFVHTDQWLPSNNVWMAIKGWFIDS